MYKWKHIEGYEDKYMISDMGDIYSIKSKKCIHPYINKCGHLKVMLCENNKKKKYFVHILVAKTFIENPHNYNIVNHIDGNKTNNRVENLEWCTQSENIKHAWNTGLIKRKKVLTSG